MPSARRPAPLSVSTPHSIFHDGRGFHLLGFSVFVCALGLGVFFVLPHLRQRQMDARAAAVIRDLRAFAAGINRYARERGDWPAAGATVGDPPVGLEKALLAAGWNQPTPVGGRYVWAPNSVHQGERYRAVIVLADREPDPVTTDRAQLEEIDRRLDDGKLPTGQFRLGYRNYPMWVIEH